MSRQFNNLRRTQHKQRQRVIVIVVCEGDTEYAYLDAWRRAATHRSIELKIYRSNKTTPHHLVATAVQKKMQALRGESPQAGDSTWVVCDGDEHRGSETERKQWLAAMATAKEQGVEVAWSNPSFELWLLLRFADQRATLTTEQAVQKLKQFLPNYDKGDRPVVRAMGTEDVGADHAPLQVALARADLLALAGKGELPNPMTRFGLLLRALGFGHKGCR